ncbi:MAG: YjbQ family protein [Deltaproteobacteria bacterium]|nr:YjbQ family protein [Deltaproteobacteria bacterium]
MHHSYELFLETSDDTDIIDISDQVAGHVRQSGVTSGLAVVFTPGSTAAVTTIEFESGAVEDLRQAIARVAPEKLVYAHDRRWGDGNGYSHVRSALLGPSITVPIVDGQLSTGTWQQIVVLDFDNRPRRRRVLIHVHGEAG